MKEKLLLSVILLFFITGYSIFAEENKNPSGIRPCVEQKPSSNRVQLRCLRSSEEVQTVKDGFADIVRKKNACGKKDYKDAIIDANKYLPFSRYPWMVVEERIFSRSGGTQVYFIFRKGPPRKFEAHLEMNDNAMNVFRLFLEDATTKEMIELIKKLRDKEFDEFWIPPPGESLISGL